jgi:hypothetical protein
MVRSICLSQRSLIVAAVLVVVVGQRVDAASSAPALEVSGVLLEALDAAGRQVAPVWHTSLDLAAMPLGYLLDADPVNSRLIPLQNDGAGGEMDRHLLPGVHIVTLFWQMDRAGIPPGMLLNIYFAGDNLTPGISAIVKYSYGFANFQVNTAPSTLSLYLRDVENTASLFYDDGTLRAELVAAFYMLSAGSTSQWRPSDLKNIDRVGVRLLRANGAPDGVLVFQLLVGPSPQQPTPQSGNLQVQPGALIGPLQAQVGSDLWRAPARTPLPTAAPTGDTKTSFQRTGEQEPGATPSGEPAESPTADGTHMPDETATPAGTPEAGDAIATPNSSPVATAQVTPSAGTLTPRPTAIAPGTKALGSEGMGSPTRAAQVTATPRAGGAKRERHRE